MKSFKFMQEKLNPFLFEYIERKDEVDNVTQFNLTHLQAPVNKEDVTERDKYNFLVAQLTLESNLTLGCVPEICFYY
jgi:hypothetical protein